MEWTEEQVVALSPDAGSTKKGRELSNAKKWQLICGDERALWGECKGSAKEPYRTQIDLKNIGFNCSCPSHKFPCKHGLGLFLMYAHSPNIFKKQDYPEWVKTWLDKRDTKEQKSAEPKKPVDEKAKAKRQESREKKILDGIDSLQIWLKDIVRTGLLSIAENKDDKLENMKTKMIDYQAPGLANMVQSIIDIDYSQDGYKEELLEKISKLYSVTVGYQSIKNYPELLQEDLNSIVGIAKKQEELKEENTIQDVWMILGKQTTIEESLKVQRNWLYGTKSKKFALVLNFAHGNMPLDMSLMPGTALEAKLTFFPSLHPLRAIVKERFANTDFQPIPGFSCLNDVEVFYTEILSKNPYIESLPLVIESLIPIKEDNSFLLRDKNGKYGFISSSFGNKWELLSHTGGKPYTMAVIMERKFFIPLGFWKENKYILL